MNKKSVSVCAGLLVAVMGLAQAFNLRDLNADKVVSGSKKIVKAVAGISDEDEIAIGAKVAQEMTAKFGAVNNPKLVAYVDQVGQALAKQCSRPAIPYHFAILNSADINAFAAPGGYIFVTRGILDFLKDEAELAGVLGHEISHVTRKHVVKAIQKSNLLSAGADFATSSAKNPYLQEQIAKFTMELLLKGLSRQDELEADSFGTTLAAKTGYTPLGMRDAMTRLGQMEGKSTVVDHFKQTHPPAAERLVVIDRVIASQHLPTNGPRQKHRFETQMEASHA